MIVDSDSGMWAVRLTSTAEELHIKNIVSNFYDETTSDKCLQYIHGCRK